MNVDKLKESDMLAAVERLFPADRYYRKREVPLGRKKIDLFCVPKGMIGKAFTIELKIKNWRGALWQAAVNLQVADASYIALWHEYVHRAEANAELLESYGVGLISVGPQGAEFLRRPRKRRFRIARKHKLSFYRLLLADSLGR